jgi:hypothetical protein
MQQVCIGRRYKFALYCYRKLSYKNTAGPGGDMLTVGVYLPESHDCSVKTRLGAAFKISFAALSLPRLGPSK